jgi:hypothetical protein
MDAGRPRERLREIYAAADQAVAAAGPHCDASGRCCRFRDHGHTLFLSQLEADYLLDNAPFEATSGADVCPFLVANLCTARETRALGCRVYFCDPAYQETGAAISERFIRELKNVSDEFGLPWRYAPLHVFLNERGARGQTAPDEHPTRLSLPLIRSE